MLLGLDLGTTNVKALVTDRAGQPLARGSCPVQLFRLADGGVEQDIEEIWRATLAAIQQALRAVDPARVSRPSASPARAARCKSWIGNGQPLGRVISWLDQRGGSSTRLSRRAGQAWFLERIVHGGSWLSIGQVAAPPPRATRPVRSLEPRRLRGRHHRRRGCAGGPPTTAPPRP